MTWEFGGEVSWVEVRLTQESEDTTRLELEHTAHVDGDRWEQFGPGAVGVGWDLTLVGLDEHRIIYLGDTTVKPLDLYRMLAAELASTSTAAITSPSGSSVTRASTVVFVALKRFEVALKRFEVGIWGRG